VPEIVRHAPAVPQAAEFSFDDIGDALAGTLGLPLFDHVDTH
jgi:hypothetical protein